jgi:hypothetical protein
VQALKSRLGMIGALVPLFYCGSLIYYFLDISGSMQEAGTNGLSPTLLGLGAVSLLFCIPLIMKVVRILARPRSPGPDGRGGPDAPHDDGFDADAAIARYLAQRSVEAAPAAARPAHRGVRPASPSGFGRRIR